MPLDVSGFIPDTTPNKSLDVISNSLQENTRYKQEKNYRIQKDKEQKEQQNRIFNLREIKDLTDFDKYKTGHDALDAESRKELSRIAEKGKTDYINLDPVEADMALNKEAADFFNWHTAVSSKLKQADAVLPDFNKTYSNIDYEEAKRRVHSNIIQDFVDPKTGEKRIPANLDRNYVGELHDPNVIASMTNDFSPIEKYYNSGLKPFNNSDFTSIRGVKSKARYSGLYKPGVNQVTADKNGNPIIETNFEIAPGATKNGQPLKIIDENTYQAITNTPGLAGAFLNKFKSDRSAEGEQKLDEFYVKNTGKPMDAVTRENAYKHWLYLNHNENLAPNISQDKSQTIPVINNNTTVNPGGGSSNVNDILPQIEDEMSGMDNMDEKNLTTFKTGQDIIWKFIKDSGYNVDSPKDIELVKHNDGTYVTVKYDTGKTEPDPNDNKYSRKVYKTAEFQLSRNRLAEKASHGQKNQVAAQGLEEKKPKKDPLKLF